MFSVELQDALENTTISYKDIAAEFQIPASTVERWLNGVSEPHPKLQEAVINWINNESETGNLHTEQLQIG